MVGGGVALARLAGVARLVVPGVGGERPVVIDLEGAGIEVLVVGEVPLVDLEFGDDGGRAQAILPPRPRDHFALGRREIIAQGQLGEGSACELRIVKHEPLGAIETLVAGGHVGREVGTLADRLGLEVGIVEIIRGEKHLPRRAGVVGAGAGIIVVVVAIAQELPVGPPRIEDPVRHVVLIGALHERQAHAVEDPRAEHLPLEAVVGVVVALRVHVGLVHELPGRQQPVENPAGHHPIDVGPLIVHRHGGAEQIAVQLPLGPVPGDIALLHGRPADLELGRGPERARDDRLAIGRGQQRVAPVVDGARSEHALPGVVIIGLGKLDGPEVIAQRRDGLATTGLLAAQRVVEGEALDDREDARTGIGGPAGPRAGEDAVGALLHVLQVHFPGSGVLGLGGVGEQPGQIFGRKIHPRMPRRRKERRRRIIARARRGSGAQPSHGREEENPAGQPTQGTGPGRPRARTSAGDRKFHRSGTFAQNRRGFKA